MPGSADPAVAPVDRQVTWLLGQLTVDEKIAMLHQYAPAVPRLGLAAFRTGTEALHGAAWLGRATVFPQAVGLGATWHPELLRRVGEATAVEVRALHAKDPTVSLNVWAPVVNPLRDPRWGRNEEGYAEDPLLVSRLAVAFCRGLRGDHPHYLRTAPTLKHFLAYNNETDRCLTSSSVRPRVLHEYDLPVFTTPIAAGVVEAVMPSYNLVNGRPNHVSPYLHEVLRAATGRDVLVVSDAEAPSNLVDAEHYFDDHVTSHAAALRAGVDSFTDHATEPSFTVDRLTRALREGLVTTDDLDRAVRRILTVRARTGEFAGPDDPYAGIDEQALDTPEHRQLALQAAREQIVLLRNDGHLLPLRPSRDLRVAVLGPLAEQLCEDWYSGTMPYRVTVADGVRQALAEHGATVLGSEGVDRIALSLADTGAVLTVADDGRIEATTVDSPTAAAAVGSVPAAQFDVFAWGEGILTLRSAATRRYLTADGDGSLSADRRSPGGWDVLETFRLLDEPAPAGRTGAGPDAGLVVLQHVHSGAYVRIDDTGVPTATAIERERAQRFVRHRVVDGTARARALAEQVDVALVVVGNDPHINGRETQDRTTLDLPPEQERLVRAVTAAAPRTVLLVMSSYPYALAWADDHVPAILWSSHAGQETGRAVADVLLGRHAPTGRLPQTWYRSTDDLPDLLEYDVIKARRTYQYFTGTPLYPFGHGLTYTTFGYGPVRLSRSADTVSVSVDVTNTGRRAGVEVVQLYTRDLTGRADRPVRRLQAFERVALDPGRTARVVLDFPTSGLAHWDVARHALHVEPGRYEVLVGGSGRTLPATGTFDVPGPEDPPRAVVGTPIAAVDFDDYEDVVLVDTTPERGEAVATRSAAGGRLLFRRVVLPADLSVLSRIDVRVSRAEPGTALVEVRADDPVTGPLLARVVVPSTGDRYRWTTVTAPVTGAGDAGGHRARDAGWTPTQVRDLHLVLRGEFRLDTFRLGAPGGGPDGSDPADGGGR